MSQKQNKVSVIYYDNKNRPKHFEFKKSLIKSLIYVLPSITLISLAIAIAGILYFKQIRELARRSESDEIIELRTRNSELTTKQVDVEKLSIELQNRLASKVVIDKSALEGLTFFKPVQGQKNLSSTPPFSIQEPTFQQSNGKVKFTFKIQNDTKQGKKLVGYVFIIQQNKNTFNFFPSESFKEDQIVSNYNQGELFAVTRFRPTSALFPSLKGQTFFRVVIFSPTGDVLLKNVFKHKQ